MKRVLRLFIFISFIFLLSGCNMNQNYINKTEFFLNEDAYIDDISIKMTKASINENNMLEIVFSITNNRKNTITLVADNYFKLYDINKVQIHNQYQNNTNIIKKDQTINYTLIYDIKDKEIYEIYFYSGIVENNIKFTITGNELANN